MIGLDLQGDGLFSSVGLAACVPVQAAELGQGRAGVPRRLRLPVRDQAARPDVAAAATSPRGARSRSATRPARRRAPRRPGRSRRSTCSSGLPGLVLEVSGADAPPSVTLTGPAGAAEPLVLRDEAARTTYLAVAAPRAGRWRLTLEPGSSAVTAVRRGDGLPAPSVKARVSGRGHARTLHWTVRALPGQVVRFARGGPRRGRADRHAPARPAAASASGPRTARRGGARSSPSSSRRASSASGSSPAATPPPPRSAPPGRRASRCGAAAARLTVRWKRAAGASTHRVQAQLSDGRRLLLEVKRPLAADPGLRPARDRDGLGARRARGLRRRGRGEADQAGALSASAAASSASSRRSTERSTGSSAPCRRTSGRSGGS